jgi:sigma-B regulation protein RsbU (phosphoserine phosphatase)
MSVTASDAPKPVILVVDDTEANRESLGRRLERRGYGVDTAVDGEDALAKLRATRYDLVLLDIMMPGLSGIDVLRTIRQEQPASDLPIIMCTAKDQSEDMVQAFELGANDYVTKPLDFAVVMARVKTHLELGRSVRQIRELEKRLSERNAELELAIARTRSDLEAAARVQSAFLPHTAPKLSGFDFAWKLIPCTELAGDSLNVFRLDHDHVAAYVLDVSGHGVAAALPAVAATRLLMPGRDPDSILTRDDGQPDAGKPVPPVEIAERVDRWFKSNPDTHQFVTLFYAMVNARTRVLTYVSAAHPPAVLVRQGKAELLRGSGLPIGLGEGYEQTTRQLEKGDRVYLYTDGVPESQDAARETFGMERVLASLEASAGKPLQETLDDLLAEVRKWCGEEPQHDDISLIAIQCG